MEQKGTGKALGDLAEALRELPREDKTTDVCEILLASSFVNVVHEHLFIDIVLLLLFVSVCVSFLFVLFSFVLSFPYMHIKKIR